MPGREPLVEDLSPSNAIKVSTAKLRQGPGLRPGAGSSVETPDSDQLSLGARPYVHLSMYLCSAASHGKTSGG